MTARVLTDQEVNTILHALRSMAANQRDDIKDACDGRQCDHFGDAPALDSVAVDALCESIGLDGLILVQHTD
jgi:hypothetical protein